MTDLLDQLENDWDGFMESLRRRESQKDSEATSARPAVLPSDRSAQVVQLHRPGPSDQPSEKP